VLSGILGRWGLRAAALPRPDVTLLHEVLLERTVACDAHATSFRDTLWHVPVSSRRRSVVKASLDNILLRLSVLPARPEVDELREKAADYRRQADAWTSTEPASEEKERLMKRALKLHADVAKLERQPDT
jgi:hypothetical protein